VDVEQSAYPTSIPNIQTRLGMKRHRFQVDRTTRQALMHLKDHWLDYKIFRNSNITINLSTGVGVNISVHLVEKEPLFECQRIVAEISDNIGLVQEATQACNDVYILET